MQLTMGDDAATGEGEVSNVPLKLTDWERLEGALSDGPEDVGNQLFTFTVEVVGIAANGQVKAILSANQTRSIQNADLLAGELDIFGTTPAPLSQRKKLIHAIWTLQPAVGS